MYCRCPAQPPSVSTHLHQAQIYKQSYKTKSWLYELQQIEQISQQNRKFCVTKGRTRSSGVAYPFYRHCRTTLQLHLATTLW